MVPLGVSFGGELKWQRPRKLSRTFLGSFLTFRDWQYPPFLSFVLYIKGQTLEHPYYQERLAMLKVWADSDNYRDLVHRREGSDGQLIEIVRIDAFELAPEGHTVDPYVIVTDGDRQILSTRHGN